jgi:small GTP-binding protein
LKEKTIRTANMVAGSVLTDTTSHTLDRNHGKQQQHDDRNTVDPAGEVARTLPHTVLLEVLLHCGPGELSAAAGVCQRWAEACRIYDRTIWSPHVAEVWTKRAASSFYSRDDNSKAEEEVDSSHPLYAELYAQWARRQAKATGSDLGCVPPWALRQLSPPDGGSSTAGPSSSLVTGGPGVHYRTDPSADYDVLIKYLLIGDSGVGKTSFLQRASDDTFSDTWISTIGVDFKIRTLDVGGTRVKMQMWDTAGQERFRTITSAYYRGAGAIYVCFDITDRSSFENVTHWLEEIDRHSSSAPVVMLVACKSDLEASRQVSRIEAQAMADQHGITLSEVSAKTGTGVEECVLNMTELALSGTCGLLPSTLPEARHFLRTACAIPMAEIEARFPSRRDAGVLGQMSGWFKRRREGASWACSIV